MSKTNQTLKGVLLQVWDCGYTIDTPDTQGMSVDQALKEISELLVECKQHIPNGVEEFKHTVKRGESTWVVDRESYNLGQDDYIKNIKELL